MKATISKINALLVCGVSLAASCTKNRTVLPGAKSSVSAFSIGNYMPKSGGPSWTKLDLVMQRQDGDKAAVKQSYGKDDFKNGNAESVNLTIPQGTYTINLSYLDDKGTVVYKTCDPIAAKTYDINTPTFSTEIQICTVTTPNNTPQATTPNGSVPVTPASNVTLNPRDGQGSPKTATDGYPYCTNGSNTGNGWEWDPAVQDPKGGHSCHVPQASANGATDGYPDCTNGTAGDGNGWGWDTAVKDPKGGHSCHVASGTDSANKAAADGYPYCTNGTSGDGNGWGSDTAVKDPKGGHSCHVQAQTDGHIGACVTPGFGLPSGQIPGGSLELAASGSLSSLPQLDAQASASQIKAFVAKVYDAYPQFKQIFEKTLGMNRQQTLGFMYATMSRESAGDVGGGAINFHIKLETGQGGAGHAWGPFQAAVTNFTGGGYDQGIQRYSGLPVPSMNDFFNPAISTYAGMKRLADGILNSMRSQYFGTDKSASQYLLGTLADHNTGYPSAANDGSWLNDYGNEVLRLMQGYEFGSNLTNDRVFWTNQATLEICR